MIRLLRFEFGRDAEAAFDPDATLPGPAAQYQDSAWLKTANTVGVNVRTIQHFWNIVPYALTLPDAQSAIHILPIWEPGVVSSLYGPSSWNINPEFYCPELERVFPALNTVERQLKAVVNVLHLLGKQVGMDVVPHTDRFSEQALANPMLFEWLQRRDLEILRHSTNLYEDVQMAILAWVLTCGSAVPEIDVPHEPALFFSGMPETVRLRCLFGEKEDYAGRLARRKILVRQLYDEGFETVPATMGPPYRGIEVDTSPDTLIRDEDGLVWRDYRIRNPQTMSRVFGPLARYRLYESIDNNRRWELDFDKPNKAAWEYVCAHYQQIQAQYNFDFMRGDMSHVQMRPEGVPAEPGDYYDLQRAVKCVIGREKPWFGYFAESFLAPPGEMAYGDECDHLEASLADSTLGNLQSEPVGTRAFVQEFSKYQTWLNTRQFAPNFTIFTADKDDPRFDKFYLTGNEARYFMALFLTDMPSYMGLGFECRDPHPKPAPNECYTKLYVFQLSDGPKGTRGPYQWGQNARLYANLVRQKMLSDRISPLIASARTEWLIPPDPKGKNKVIAWTQSQNPQYVFVVNLDTRKGVARVEAPAPGGKWQLQFSTLRDTVPQIKKSRDTVVLENILPGEGLMLGA